MVFSQFFAPTTQARPGTQLRHRLDPRRGLHADGRPFRDSRRPFSNEARGRQRAKCVFTHEDGLPGRGKCVFTHERPYRDRGRCIFLAEGCDACGGMTFSVAPPRPSGPSRVPSSQALWGKKRLASQACAELFSTFASERRLTHPGLRLRRGEQHPHRRVERKRCAELRSALHARYEEPRRHRRALQGPESVKFPSAVERLQRSATAIGHGDRPRRSATARLSPEWRAFRFQGSSLSDGFFNYLSP